MTNTIHLIYIKNILYCKSNNSYTTFYIANQKPIVVSRNIKEFEKELIPYNFFRTHQSYLVNLEHIRRIEKLENFSLILNSGTTIPT
ncbi:MAG: LytTR family transcriptional regulator DNA-binding domain-containing protein [Prolixibacteraceae bacterium]|nr:LytTR family transcriptional regulator DNA-binding domain-containing protein [Prolixibacteraceae bacterium]